MEPKKVKAKHGPEYEIQQDLIKYLKIRDWFVVVLHGNLYQMGLPDLYATHSTYGPRWIEVKNKDKWQFTDAQINNFPKLLAYGTQIWILTAATEEEYNKLFKPCNCHEFFLEKLVSKRNTK